ncbi:MBL fold metallo-hydrolase [Paracoccus albus]|uniref:MBL fold metallo-hydrolase n=1 Tax=Paracoccus albus TaxID=3017784 RepID=UPI0022F10948|nr:MBL fold metallo-hydrolase [Paracoccus albus]WBU61382.1 MBL fold metallo-hydrolase [Paracoccus albus]
MLQTILAPNPSPLTGSGTNTFLLGQTRIAIIDPGPDILSHRQAILEAGQGRISHILVTHAHLDHSEGAAALAKEAGAPILALGRADAGRSAVMETLVETAGGGEGRDTDFRPDQLLRDGDVVEGEGWMLRAVHTPGHMGNHLSYLWDDQLFCGDIILGWSSTLISPPDGDLVDYFRSLDRIESLQLRKLFPAHGQPVDDPASRIAELRLHRRQRSAQILGALRSGPSDAATIAQTIYDVPPQLLPAAARNVLAHLIAMAELGVLVTDAPITPTTLFSLP